VRVSVRLGASLTIPILPLFIQSLLPAGAKVASTTGLVSGLAAAASAVSAVVLGRASDRYGYRPVLLACAAVAALLWAPHYFLTAPWQLLALQAALGFVMGGVFAAVTSSMANLAPEGRQGAVYGIDASVTSAASALAPMIGASVAAGFGLRVPFLLTAGAMALSALLVWLRVPGTQRPRL
jgi:DHA1 family multidrug resistance protein-like MFS transporter